jgi:hypothetical protein
MLGLVVDISCIEPGSSAIPRPPGRRGWVVLDSRKVALALMPVLLLGAGVAAWLLGTWSLQKAAPAAPDAGDITMVTGKFNLPDPGQACTVVVVNNSGKSVESMVLKFSTQATPTLMQAAPGANGGTVSFGSRGGEFRPTGPLKPGERAEYLKIVATGSHESVTVGSGERAKTHAIATPLAAGKRLVISYEPDDKLSTRME